MLYTCLFNHFYLGGTQASLTLIFEKRVMYFLCRFSGDTSTLYVSIGHGFSCHRVVVGVFSQSPWIDIVEGLTN